MWGRGPAQRKINLNKKKLELASSPSLPYDGELQDIPRLQPPPSIPDDGELPPDNPRLQPLPLLI